MNTRDLLDSLSQDETTRNDTIKETIQSSSFTHVTREENLDGILSKGLDPNKGGKNGASAAAGSKHFIKNSTGYIHVGNDSEAQPAKLPSSQFYTAFFQNQGIPSTVLHTVIPRNQDSLIADPDDKQGGRYKTTEAILRSELHKNKPFSLPNNPKGRVYGPVYAPASLMESTQNLFPREALVSKKEIYATMTNSNDQPSTQQQRLEQLQYEEMLSRHEHAEKQALARQKYGSASKGNFQRAERPSPYGTSPRLQNKPAIEDHTGPEPIEGFSYSFKR